MLCPFSNEVEHNSQLLKCELGIMAVFQTAALKKPDKQYLSQMIKADFYSKSS